MKLLRLALVPCAIFGMTLTGNAQKKDDKKKEEPAKTTQTPTATPPVVKPAETPKPGPKPYKDVITDKAKTSKGLITVHKIDEKYFFEIADTLLGRDIMTVTRYSKTAAGGGIFGGEEVNRQMIRWEKGPDNKIFLRSISIVMSSPDSTKPIFQAVRNSSADPIVGAFDIKAIKKDTVSVIEVTDFFKADNQIFSLDPVSKQLLKITAQLPDRSYIQHIRSYPINTEIRTVKTFGVVPPSVSLMPIPQIGQYLPASRDAGVVTMEFNTSMILLPKVPMRKRFFDQRVGYFANQYSVFGEESQKSDNEVFAVRWKLEPKSKEDAERQKRGEAIEPKKPIVYYIDPATPKKWQKYLKAGVDDWQKAFEKAGWKNAIRGEYLDPKDSLSLEDARYSVIRYFAADIQNAYGPNVHDPRSGEILESHIGWYHNVMRLLRNWYMIQTAAVDTRARTKNFSDELMGELVRFVSSHEVGHTLGLRHNMGASSATPVEKLRDKNWVAKNGHTSSIMDYARFNYVAQPEDGVTDLFPRIGDYDEWAIKWGYGYFADAKDAKEEKKLLNELTKEATKDPRKRFGTEISPYDPRYQTEDLSDNAMKASDYGIKNLQRILPNLTEWSKEDGEFYKELSELYGNVVGQYRRYIGHVTKNVGGVYDTPKTYDMEGSVYEVVPKATQKEAVAFLNRQVFATPTWLINPAILNKINIETGVEAIKSIQESTLNNLLAGDRAARLMETGSTNPANYNLDELMTDLRGGIWAELKTRKAIDVYRRNLQKVYVEKVITLLNPTSTMLMSVPPGVTYGYETRMVDLKKTDLPSIARANLESLKAEIKAALPLTTDKMSKYHLQDVLSRIEKALDPK
ncbi:zinc-dependent metalloprotease [Emticicia fluvialis]|uniref:zinc-dependent metalloprotease n=1 Tax=Emticicia fluvialis TaxID=2974474 RepID=UPI0021651DF4|nr:zinc-dependent metalloprotease [Emticicia fluvialis]